MQLNPPSQYIYNNMQNFAKVELEAANLPAQHRKNALNALVSLGQK